ncbi:MAG: HAD family hydrolase [Planctomycetota bacterium]
MRGNGSGVLMWALVLFDIDGTLMDAAGAGRSALQRTAEGLFGGELDFRGVATAGRLDRAIFAEAAANAGWDECDAAYGRLCGRYPEELAAELVRLGSAVRVLPGAMVLLNELRARDGVVLGCVTGNQRAAAAVKLRAVGIDPGWFGVGGYGDEAATRPELVAMAMRRHAEVAGEPVASERVVVVGDTPHDIDAANRHGCVSVAVATGRYGEAELAAAGADVVMEGLRDPGPVLDLVKR